MAQFIQENGTTDKPLVRGSLIMSMETFTKDSGLTIKRTEKVFTLMRRVLAIKAHGKMISNTAWVLKYGMKVRNTREFMRWERKRG